MTDQCPRCGSASVRTACEGTDRLFRTTAKRFLVVECLECHLLRLFPKPPPEELATYYPRNYWYDPQGEMADRFAEQWRGFVLRDHISFVRKALRATPESGLVLDVGCGGGLLLKELGLPRRRILGLDNSAQAASVAWGANGVPAICASLDEAPLREGSCSLISMFHVLEHLYEPAAYLRAARNLLHAGGRLIVQVPNAACWQFLLLGENWNGIDIPRHLTNFRQTDVERLLHEEGFEIVRVKHFSLRDNPAGLASSLAPALDPMGRRCREPKETSRVKLFKDLAYFALVLASIPLTWFEAACRAGSTVMIEARPAARGEA